MRFRVRSIPLGAFLQSVDPAQLTRVLNEGAYGGYRFKREEVTLEPRRFLFALQALAMNILFKWEPDESPYEYKVYTYRTRVFTQTVDRKKLQNELNAAARGGFEVYFAFKHPTRFMFLWPRETYFFVLRRRVDQPNAERSYRFVEYAYRFFSGTMDPVAYERLLNEQGGSSRHVVSFRDERRQLGMRRAIALTLFEDVTAGAPAFVQAGQNAMLPPPAPMPAAAYAAYAAPADAPAFAPPVAMPPASLPPPPNVFAPVEAAPMSQGYAPLPPAPPMPSIVESAPPSALPPPGGYPSPSYAPPPAWGQVALTTPLPAEPVSRRPLPPPSGRMAQPLPPPTGRRP